MTWDAAKPAGSQKIRLSDEEIRANWAALEDALARNHNFAGTLGGDAGEHTVVELQDQAGNPATPASVIGLYNNADKLYFRLASSGTVTEITQAIPSGTKMLFVQNSAPTSWTFVSENNDTVFINQSTEGNGATTGGSWTISGVSVDGHTLTTSEMPAHTHTGSFSSSGGETAAGGSGASVKTSAHTTSSTGGGGSHTHNMTLGSSWRPAWVGVISCTKD